MKNLMRTRIRMGGTIAALAIVSSGCAMTSDGLELAITRPDADVEWRSNDGVSGTVTTLLPDGHAYRGAYLLYENRILASLVADDGEVMRCQFRLESPAIGLSGGGEGECRLGDGALITAHLVPARAIERASS
jgi:hypothetical protein